MSSLSASVVFFVGPFELTRRGLYECQEPHISMNKISILHHEPKKTQTSPSAHCVCYCAGKGRMQVRDSECWRKAQVPSQLGQVCLAHGLTFRSTYLTFDFSLDHHTPTTSTGSAWSTFLCRWGDCMILRKYHLASNHTSKPKEVLDCQQISLLK
jgi:hypothetical protein